MLFDGLLERIAQARGAMQQKNIELKGKKITQAINIVMGLRDSLNIESGDMAANLDSLYDYIQRTLMQAHVQNDEGLLDECVVLIKEISSAWREIG